MIRTLAARARRVRQEVETPADLWLGFRIVAVAAFVRVMKYVWPLPRLIKALTPRVTPAARDRRLEARVVRFAVWAARLVRPFNGGSCLERSMVLYRELARVHASPRLFIGFRRNHGTLVGHAWVVVDGAPVFDSAVECASYEVAMTFEAGGRSRQDAA